MITTRLSCACAKKHGRPAPNRAGAATPPDEAASAAEYDNRLVERFRAGDESAFVEIMERHRGRIFGLANNLLRNAADAEEVTQDTFIRAHRGLAEFRGDSALSTWLHRIALNLSRNRHWYFFRRRRQDSIPLEARFGGEAGVSFSDLIAAPAQTPVQETVTQEFTELIAGCMERLEPRHREILVMRSVRNLPYDEIASALGMNVGTVKSRIARARERLRKLLGETAPEFARASEASDYFEHTRPAHGCETIAYA